MGVFWQQTRMSSTVESSLSQLTKLGKPFKYIGMITGLQTASSCFWDNSTDGKTLEDWVSISDFVFGLAI
uniref:Uncharacterized protein n=1 Tax=Sinocyclocheilus anshuiensis TaxID=1608454 RepID=A0A671N256_9TELE